MVVSYPDGEKSLSQIALRRSCVGVVTKCSLAFRIDL